MPAARAERSCMETPDPRAQRERSAVSVPGGQGGTSSPACCDELEAKQGSGNSKAGVGVKRLQRKVPLIAFSFFS